MRGYCEARANRLQDKSHPYLLRIATELFAGIVVRKGFDGCVVPEAGMPQPEPMAQISSLLRTDPNLDAESAGAVEAIVRAAYERLRKPER